MKRKTMQDILHTIPCNKNYFWFVLMKGYMSLRLWDLCSYMEENTKPSHKNPIIRLSDPYSLQKITRWLAIEELPGIKEVTVLQVVTALTETNYNYSDFSEIESQLFDLIIYVPFTMELEKKEKE